MAPDRESMTRWWDLPAALILLASAFLAAVRLNATNWTEELALIQTITLFGVLSGLALGQSAFTSRTVGWFSTAYGLFTIFWQLGSVFGKGVLWMERISSLLGRLGFSFGNLIRQRAVTDPIMFLFLIGILFWILSAHAGYTLTRHANAWRSALPLGIALFIIHIHDPYWTSRSWFLAGYIFLALLLVSRVNFLHKRQGWQESRTHMPPFVGLDFLRTTMVAGGFLILFAWTAPAMAANFTPAQEAWQIVSRPWYEARARMTNAFASLRATVGVVQDYYGEILPLGRGNTLTDVVVFTVDAPPRPAAGVRYYWRARSYETWTGTGWQADPNQVQKLEPDEESIVLPNLEGRWEADFTFTALTPLSTLYIVPQPQWVSRPAMADLLLSPEGVADILRLSTTPSIRPGEKYVVHSSLTNVTEAELRAAGTSYPAYITERYLQIPDTITRRTRELAAEIAAPFDNPYDQVEAVTGWLRENITYQDIVPVPPQNRDIIDWMLFDLGQGFCNYYATAEIMMLRSLGIPSRLAVGYAQGQRDPETNIYTVRQRDAHAWPEVFFSGIGWVEFEPTLNQRPLRRPPGDPLDEGGGSGASGGGLNGPGGNPRTDRESMLGFEETQQQENPDLAQEDLDQGFLASYWGWLASGGALILGAAIYSWYRSLLLNPTDPLTPVSLQIEKRFRNAGVRAPSFLARMARRAALPFEARAYEQINRSLTRLGAKPGLELTPAERAGALTRILPESRIAVEALLTTYHRTVYFSTNGSSSESSRATALQSSRQIRSHTWRAMLRRFFSRFQESEDRREW